MGNARGNAIAKEWLNSGGKDLMNRKSTARRTLISLLLLAALIVPINSVHSRRADNWSEQ